jgi:ERCC4-type nuclease
MNGPVQPTSSRLIVKRGGKAITGTIPKPAVLIDTREQLPFTFEGFGNWIASARRATLPTGDYSVEGMETLLTLERKSLFDLVGTLMHNRDRFFAECERMTEFKWKAILVEASYEDIKSPYTQSEFVKAHPNGVIGSLDAVEAKFGIPVIFTSQNRALAEEKAASWLSKHFTYWWLESNHLGRVLQEGDL